MSDERVIVRCWGTRGSIPTPGPSTVRYGGNTTSIEIRYGDTRIIFDAGSGIRPLGTDLVEKGPNDVHIFLTHFHWDHIQGFPFFAPLYDAEDTIRVIGPRQKSIDVQNLFAGQMGPIYFPVPYSLVAARMEFEHLNDGAYQVDGFDMEVMRVKHPSFVIGYRIRVGGQVICFIPDNELAAEQHEAGADFDDRIVDFVGGADLLIHDSMYTDEEYETRSGWGHSTFSQSVRLAESGGAKKLLFFHHDPKRTDEELDTIVARTPRGTPARVDRRSTSVRRQKGWSTSSEGRPVNVKRLIYIVTIVSVLPLLAFGSNERTASTHWALLIGISDYIHFDDVEGGDLPGAEHDARGLRDGLVMRYGFPEGQVRLLLNGDATKEGIREGITTWLRENARPGDNVVISFSGHGSQMWDESGDEDDGLDETIAPADVLPNSTERDISDDEFNDWLGMLPTNNVVVILDNCNSGTGTRDVTPFSRGRLLARDINRIEQPAGMARRALPGQQDESGFEDGSTRVLELAAAQPHQIAVDAFFPAGDTGEEFHGGAFTTFLLQELWRAPGDATYQEVFEGAYEALKRNRFQQDPYISEATTLRELPLFFVEGGSDGAGDVSLPILDISGSTAQLGGGLALGITRGSIFETGSGARLVIESVQQRGATARVTDGSVRDGDRASLVAHRYVRSPLLLGVAGIDTRLAEAIGAALPDGSAIRLVHDEDSFSHLIVRRRGESLRIVGADGFVHYDDIPADVGSMDAIAELAAKEAAAKTLGDMENPGQTFGFELELAGGETTFGLGEEISFNVESDRDGYLTLVDIDPLGTVSVLLPNEDVPSVPVRAGRRFTYPEGDIFFEAQEPLGSGMVRAFVTPEPLPLDVPPGELFLRGGEELTERVIDAVIATVGTEGEAVRLGAWATSSVVYEIRN